VVDVLSLSGSLSPMESNINSSKFLKTKIEKDLNWSSKKTYLKIISNRWENGGYR